MKEFLVKQRLYSRCPWISFAVAIFLANVISIRCHAQLPLDLREATVKRSDGTVQIVEKNGTVSDAYAGAVLTPGQTLRTGTNGSAEIALQGNGAVRVEMDSEVKLPEAKDKSPSQESLQMLKGRLFMNIDAEVLKKQGHHEFRLKTPAAILAVKGTKFFAFASAEGDTIGVHQGQVLTWDQQSRKTQQIRAGTALDASPNKLSTPRAFKEIEKFYDVQYISGLNSALVVPLGNGERWLTLGFVASPNGTYYYKKDPRKSEVFAMNANHVEKAIPEIPSSAACLIADDESVFYSVGHRLLHEGEFDAKFGDGKAYGNGEIYGGGGIYQLNKKSSTTQLFCAVPIFINSTGSHSYNGGKAIRDTVTDRWQGCFSFGRTPEGAVDKNTLYLADDSSEIWRIKKLNGLWDKPEGLVNVDSIDGLVVIGSNEAYIIGIIFEKNGSRFSNKWQIKDYTVRRLKNWKDFETIVSLPKPDVRRLTIMGFGTENARAPENLHK